MATDPEPDRDEFPIANRGYEPPPPEIPVSRAERNEIEEFINDLDRGI